MVAARYFLFLMLFVSATAMAQLEEKLTIYVSGGGAVPVESFLFARPILLQGGDALDLTNDPGNFNDFYDNGINLDVGLNYTVFSNLALVGRFSYNYFNFNHSALEQAMTPTLKEIFAQIEQPYVPANLSLEGGAASIYLVTLGVRTGLDIGVFRPYLIGGGGWMHVSREQVDISYVDDLVSFFDRFNDSSSNAPVLTGGAGMQVRISDTVRPFLQFDYTNGFTDNDNTILYGFRFGLQLGLQTD